MIRHPLTARAKGLMTNLGRAELTVSYLNKPVSERFTSLRHSATSLANEQQMLDMALFLIGAWDNEFVKEYA